MLNVEITCYGITDTDVYNNTCYKNSIYYRSMIKITRQKELRDQKIIHFAKIPIFAASTPNFLFLFLYMNDWQLHLKQHSIATLLLAVYCLHIEEAIANTHKS